MNYGKLTAGTTKTAIDTAKPSEKGEIITYLSRMGDVLDDIFERCKFVISGSGIHAIRDGNEPHLILREDYFRVAPDFQIVAAKARQVFYNNRSHPPLLDQFHHFSKCRAVKVCAGVAIIHKELAIRKTVFLGILPQNGALGLDAHAFAADFIIAAQSAI